MSAKKPENLLLDAVDALTNPVWSKVIQEDMLRPSGTKTIRIELPSLLEQLDEAIRGTMGGGGGSLPSERNLLDSDALFRLIKISSMIGDWARAAGAVVVKDDAGTTLRNWYVSYSVKLSSMESERFYIGKLNAWAHQIEAKLDPPRVKDLPDACPVCGAVTWWLASTKAEYPRPLVIEYKPTGPNLIQEARALCRSCETVWGVRELAYELEQAEARHAVESGMTTAQSS